MSNSNSEFVMKSLYFAFLIFIGAVNFLQAQDADTVTIDAFSLLSASGRFIETGTDRHTFVGEMHGPYFIDVGEGPIPAGEIVCVGRLNADDSTGAQSVSADCRLEADDGAVAYGGFECTGYRLVGCSGPFQLVGGEGRLAGTIGQGQIVLRRFESDFFVEDNGEVQELALGIASWKNFVLREVE